MYIFFFKKCTAFTLLSSAAWIKQARAQSARPLRRNSSGFCYAQSLASPIKVDYIDSRGMYCCGAHASRERRLAPLHGKCNSEFKRHRVTA